jgi:hypothetical protein
MPNHCYNFIEVLHHDDPAIIKRLKECLEREYQVFFEEFVPCPEGVERNAYWGTKWDVYDVVIEEFSENSMSLTFNTAWAPPTGAYQKLKEMGFTIRALFVEPGTDFCGYWHDGKDIVYENVRENLADVPEEFHEYFIEDESEEEDEVS